MSEMMIYGIKPQQAPEPWWPTYMQYSGADRLLSPPECKAIIDHMDKVKLRPGSIGTTQATQRLDPDYRSVMTESVPPAGFEWLYHRIIERVAWVNSGHYRFEISGMNEMVQFLEYRMPKKKKEVSGRYNWHMDAGPGIASNRKLSVVIQLSDPSEYEGCRLALFDNVTPVLEVPEIGQGDMVVFPSFTPHMVTPLTKGVRRSLAVWISGPTFR